MRRLGFLAATAAALLMSAQAQAPTTRHDPVIQTRPPAGPARKVKRSKKRKAKVRDVIRKWRGSGVAGEYTLRRNFHPGRSSTLKKTAKLFRLLGRA